MSKDIGQIAVNVIMSPEDFYLKVINPANKTFIVPSWVIDFAEKYADYKAASFYRLKLQLETEEWESTCKRILGQMDSVISDENEKR